MNNQGLKKVRDIEVRNFMFDLTLNRVNTH